MACLRKYETNKLLDKIEMEIHMENKKKELEEVREQSKKLLKIQDKAESNYRIRNNLENQLEDANKRLETTSRERDKFERELVSTKTELAGVKRTLDLERQERKELESKALNLIKSAKRKWENAEKDKIEQLNKHIESQTVRITELCTSNNEMSSKLQRMETELNTANAELDKLRIFQVQYKESLNKMRELNRQSQVGVENKLEQISNRAHNQLAELRTKLELETAKNVELESKLRKEEESNTCKLSRLNVAFEFNQNELKDCQEQLRSLKATIPARDAEIENLKHQLQEKTQQLESASSMEQLVVTLQEQIERITMENNQLKQQLEATKTDLSETIMNMEVNETLSANLERATQDKNILEQQLRKSLQKEEAQGKKVNNLEELLRRFEQSVAKLEAENASLKSGQLPSRSSLNRRSGSNIEDTVKITSLEKQIESLQEQLKTAREETAADRDAARQAQRALWKKEKEVNDANLDKRIATREAKTAEEKLKNLQAEKQKQYERLSTKIKDEEEKAKKAMKELEAIKTQLADVTREASRNKLQADSAQRALTQANKQVEELQSSSASLRRELDSARKQLRSSQDRYDALQSEKERLSVRVAKFNEENNDLDAKVEKLQQEANGYQLNIELLKETCSVLEEQLNDYEKLTSNHETRENTLIQEKMKLQKDIETIEMKLREARDEMNKEKAMRMRAEKQVERLESETSDIEEERNGLVQQRDQYRKMTQHLTKQVAELQEKCGALELDLSEVRRSLELAKADARMVKEESTQYLTKVHELKEANESLAMDLQQSVDLGQDLRNRVMELEDVLDDMRHFYEEREMKSGSTQQQQTKLIDYLQLKLEEAAKKKKGVCDKIFGKQKENVPPLNPSALPIGYRELENQLESERAKVKTLTEQLLSIKATRATTPIHSNPVSPVKPQHTSQTTNNAEQNNSVTRQHSMQRIRHNIPHRFNMSLPMRTGKCTACSESIQFGKRAAICSECQIMCHLKCSVAVPANCGLPGGFSKQLAKNLRGSNESISSFGGSVQTLAIDEPDNIPERDTDCQKKPSDSSVLMESWVKIPSRNKGGWERKYLRLEGSCLCTYEHEPTNSSMSPISKLDLSEKDGFIVSEHVQVADVLGTAKSDMPFILRLESKSATTCWPNSRLDIMALSQLDKKNWLKALRTWSSRAGKTEKFQTIVRLEKRQLDLNTAVELEEDNVLLFGAEEGLFSYKIGKSKCLTAIRGVKKVYQLTLHPQIGQALMIAGEDRQLVTCDLRQLRSNALAAECSRPAITTKTVLTGSESCHLYQIQGDMLCAATASHVILLKWNNTEESGEFITVRELETQDPCSCALFVNNLLIVGCHKFFQIDIKDYSIDEFPEEDDSSVKAAICGVAKLGIFPVHVLNVSGNSKNVELLLCYNEFGVFVNEHGQRTRGVDPTWSHLPFAFAYRKPYIFIVHFTSVEIIKIDGKAFKSPSSPTERSIMELNNPRFLGLAGPRGIYISTVNSILEVLKIEGVSNAQTNSGSMTSLDSLSQNDDSSSSEFSFTSSLMEVLDGQGKKSVHFANSFNK
ncbi:citron Rho-interacting kinase-like isoform X1 [Trichogramma pretiosum]|uniref:citron Rho-interacting kinase-like isoform X1 n=1 Tax=Trichogramma pretiosum TaxID=7493 RepID=UPI0006C955FE|nr:citron Rho-interacting kinase-like isoform X1 [Trichogramma pretiosum]